MRYPTYLQCSICNDFPASRVDKKGKRYCYVCGIKIWGNIVKFGNATRELANYRLR